MRSEEEIVGGFFLVKVGGEELALPELPFGEARAWSRASAAAFGPAFGKFDGEWAPGEGLAPIEAANELAMDATIERIVAYDTTGVLGGRAGLERLSTSRIRALYRQLYEEAHPFGDDLQAALVQMATLRVNAMLAAPSAGASSTNGSSPTGGSTRETSVDGSPPASSSSSGTAPRTASSASGASGSSRPTPPPRTRSSRPTSQPASGSPG